MTVPALLVRCSWVFGPPPAGWLCKNVARFIENLLLDTAFLGRVATNIESALRTSAAFQGAEVGLRMLQIQRGFSPQIRNREPFATGWWRRERYWKLTFSRQASVF